MRNEEEHFLKMTMPREIIYKQHIVFDVFNANADSVYRAIQYFFPTSSMILSAFIPFLYRYFFYLCSSLNIFEFCSLFCSVFFSSIRAVQYSSVRFDSIRFGVTILLLFTHRSISMKHSREHVWKRVFFFF